MADTKGINLFHGVLEILTAHEVVKYLKQGDDSAKLRVATGGGMAALGYIYGPQLLQRLQGHDLRFGNEVHEKFMYAAGGAVLGGVIGHIAGPQSPVVTAPETGVPATTQLEQRVEQDIVQRPGPLILTLSTAYLAYALFFNGKSEEQRRQHWMMLGAGAVGYAYGPELIERTRTMIIPNMSVNDALDKYNKGVAIGAASGALLGYFQGDNLMEWVRGKHESDDQRNA